MKFYCLAFLAFTVPLGAMAQSSNLSNSATISPQCTIRTVQNILFPSVNPLNSTSYSGQGIVSANCTKGSFAIQIDNGLNKAIGNLIREDFSNGPTLPNYKTYYYACSRKMKHVSKNVFIDYEIYRDSDFKTTSTNHIQYFTQNGQPPVTNAADCSASTVSYNSFSFVTRGEQSMSVYAQSQPNKNLVPGLYMDTLVITIRF